MYFKMIILNKDPTKRLRARANAIETLEANVWFRGNGRSSISSMSTNRTPISVELTKNETLVRIAEISWSLPRYWRLGSFHDFR